MGKQRRQRRKFHAEPKADSVSRNDEQPESSQTTINSSPMLIPPTDNIFAGLNIDITSLNRNLPDDVGSVKSMRSIKSLVGADKPLPKKEKRALRKKLLLTKLDAVGELKKEKREQAKRRNTPIIGDTKPLQDALSSLEELLKSPVSDGKRNPSARPQTKVKGIEKSSKQRKNLLQGINIFKQIYKNKTFEKDPMAAISQHVKNVVNLEKQNKVKK